MKKYLLLLCFCSITFLGKAQEDFSGNEGFYIGSFEVPPALSFLAPELPEKHFSLPEVDIFRKDEKREVDLLAIVEREKRFQQRTVEYETPLFRKKRKDNAIEFSNNVHLYNRGSNYDFYTGQLKNPVYQEMQARLFNDVYRPYYGYRNSYYSPFFR